jgi:hypothetical protein
MGKGPVEDMADRLLDGDFVIKIALIGFTALKSGELRTIVVNVGLPGGYPYLRSHVIVN